MATESHLTGEQLAEIREELLRELARLERSMAATDEAARPVTLDQSAVGRLSRMDSLLNQSIAQNLQERERAKLAGIVSALKRIEEGSFGTCQECEDPIAYERLLVLPETPRCTACAGGGG